MGLREIYHGGLGSYESRKKRAQEIRPSRWLYLARHPPGECEYKDLSIVVQLSRISSSVSDFSCIVQYVCITSEIVSAFWSK